jgi:hypothetical protein
MMHSLKEKDNQLGASKLRYLKGALGSMPVHQVSKQSWVNRAMSD